MADVTVLMILRGVNAARLSWHGSPWVVTPALDRLAAQAMVLDRHYSPAIDRDVAMAMILPACLVKAFIDTGHQLVWIASGKHVVPAPFEKVIINTLDEHDWSQAFSTVQSRLRGKSALIVVDLPCAEPPWTLRARERDLYFPARSEGPATCDDAPDGEGLASETLAISDGTPEPDATDDFVDALPWEEEIPESVDPEDDLTHLRLIETHAAAIGHVDALAGAILDHIPARVAVLVLGDCGLELGDHGATGAFNPFPWISRVNVPCIWHDPSGDGMPRRVLAPSSHHDVAVTLAQRHRLDIPHHPFAMNLSDLSLADASGNINRAVVSVGQNGYRAIRTPDWSLMVSGNGGIGLYSLPDDPWEVLDLSSQREDEVAELLCRLEKLQSSQL